MKSSSINDDEFGEISLNRSARSKQVRIKIGLDGRLKASLPNYASDGVVKKLVESSRAELRRMLKEYDKTSLYTAGMQVGKSHFITTREITGSEAASAHIHGQQIIVSLPKGTLIEASEIQSLIRPVVIKAYRREAKSYLARRLSYLAEQTGYEYKKVRFSHASSRWGSCSTTGTISLNIALMKLPHELIDYVIIHELAHTKEMNHSKNFWSNVEHHDPNYKIHRRELRSHSPAI